MQRLLILLMSSLMLVGCVAQASFGDAITEGEPTPMPTNVVPSRPVYDVERGDVIDQRVYSGRISAVTTSPMMFEIDGRVAETFFESGDDVVAGDILAILDTTALEAQLLDAQEDLEIAQSLLDSASNQIAFAQRRAELQIELAQINLDYARLQASDPATDEENLLIHQREVELELAQLALEEIAEGVDPALEFDVSRAEEQVERISQAIVNATLLAPMDGRLLSFQISAGETVTAFQTIGVVADLSAVEVTNVIENAELSELSEGLPVVLQRANAPEQALEGILYQLPQPFGLGSDGLVHVRFSNQADSADFELGERISYVVTIAERQDVLWLPTGAIRQFSGRNFVVVQDDGVERRVDVQLGLEGNGRVEIIEGLEENQRVIAP